MVRHALPRLRVGGQRSAGAARSLILLGDDEHRRSKGTWLGEKATAPAPKCGRHNVVRVTNDPSCRVKISSPRSGQGAGDYELRDGSVPHSQCRIVNAKHVKTVCGTGVKLKPVDGLSQLAAAITFDAQEPTRKRVERLVQRLGPGRQWVVAAAPPVALGDRAHGHLAGPYPLPGVGRSMTLVSITLAALVDPSRRRSRCTADQSGTGRWRTAHPAAAETAASRAARRPA